MAITLNQPGVTLNSPNHTLNGTSLAVDPRDLIPMTSAPIAWGDDWRQMASEELMT